MRRKLKHQIGKLFKTKILTSALPAVYDVIEVNKNDGTIVKIGEVSTINEAVELKLQQYKPACTYYILEDKAILTELPTR